MEQNNATTDKNVVQEGTTVDMNVLGKREAENSATHEMPSTIPPSSSRAIVPVGNMADFVEQFEGANEELVSVEVDGTPQKMRIGKS